MGEHDDTVNYPSLRTRAIESLLVEKGILASDAVDRVVSTYEEDIGPLNGARVVARAWSDGEYKTRLLENATGAIAELGISGMQGENMVALEPVWYRPVAGENRWCGGAVSAG